MSGGKDRKSRASKQQGWEEAGGEFYQENYSADWEGLQRDPAAIATLLPSKQNRAATTRRIRQGTQQDGRTTKRKPVNSTTRRRYSTARRGSQHNDVQVSMLPDLSENLTDEERIWEEIHEIKSMPVSMAQKKEMKAQLQNATKLRLQGFDQIKWQRRKVWQQLETKWTEYIAKMELWKNSLKKIEGNFGTGVVAYFLFLRWLMFLNLTIFVLIFIFVVLPQVIFEEPKDFSCDIEEINSTQCCYEEYVNTTIDNEFSIIHIIQGTGFMEKTLMFYGMYTNKIFGYHPVINASSIEITSSLYYDLPLAYVIITAVYFLLSLFAIVKSAAREFKDRLVEGEGQFYQYCNLIFGGWDFCIHNEKSADIKHKALYNEIKGLLHAKRLEFERHNRSRELMAKLVMIRLLINLFVILLLGAAAVLIFYLFNVSLAILDPNFTPERLHSFVESVYSQSTTTATATSSILSLTSRADYFSMEMYENGFLANKLINGTSDVSTNAVNVVENNMDEQLKMLFYEFLPYLAIVCMNLLVPLIFNYLVQFEQYSPPFVIKITLLRIVFLRLSSLAVLVSRFYFLVSNGLGDESNVCHNAKRGTPVCWETFVGQQFYKLFITDFVTQFVVTFFVNFPRALLARNIDNKFIKFIGEQEFELSKHVLDIVYSQTICWLGSFYAPFLPAIATILIFFMFYIKKFACLINSKPSAILYRASRSNSLFMFVLLLSYVTAIVPVVYAVAEILPSRSCGPFRGLYSVWHAAIIAFMKLPDILQNLIFFFGTAGFAIPCFVVLTLFLYYYYAVSAANKHMIEVLKNQLVLEGHDKQFLLNRLSAFIKQQQEYQKKISRQIDMSGGGFNERNNRERGDYRQKDRNSKQDND